jgi:FkbM family methyltransferase
VAAQIARVCAVLDPFATRSYAQEGEDMVLRRLFEGEPGGFYVDVGAHHPQRFSNTWHFYERGWQGINIEPNPELIALLRAVRPRDINVEAGVSDDPGTLTYFQFNDPALNTFDERLARKRETLPGYRLVSTTLVLLRSLADVLSEHSGPGFPISFLSVDVEGYDLRVLRSNDWNRFRPRYVLAEALETSLADVAGHPQSRFLSQVGYEAIAKTVNTVFYADARRGG